jgi:3-oxoacyl-[acyl-carrier protein] reductase
MTTLLSGSRALILGGSSEIGLALTELLHGHGIRTTVTFASPAGRRRIESRFPPAGPAPEVLHLDLADAKCMEDACIASTGCPDYLIDLAHPAWERLVAAPSGPEIASYFAAAISGRAALASALSRAMLARRTGRMVFVSSAAAVLPGPGQGFYSAAKLAGEAMYRNIGLEMGLKGITTVALRPGYVSSGRGDRFLEGNRETVRRRVPTGSVISSEEVARTILFLLSDPARHINATHLTMDGGLTACKQESRT